MMYNNRFIFDDEVGLALHASAQINTFPFHPSKHVPLLKEAHLPLDSGGVVAPAARAQRRQLDHLLLLLLLEAARPVLVDPQRRHAAALRHRRRRGLHRHRPHLALAGRADELVEVLVCSLAGAAKPGGAASRQRNDGAQPAPGSLAGDRAGHCALVQVPSVPERTVRSLHVLAQLALRRSGCAVPAHDFNYFSLTKKNKKLERLIGSQF